ncbi:hypothetical protein TRVA0_009S00672 [Trichomonascus vanleenenianus]|uniref:uncharacterized protein n=1 Tax=Trichomonascus vanleenenianus TaxID=2268995 RepID=UPI003ECA912A
MSKESSEVGDSSSLTSVASDIDTELERSLIIKHSTLNRSMRRVPGAFFSGDEEEENSPHWLPLEDIISSDDDDQFEDSRETTSLYDNEQKKFTQSVLDELDSNADHEPPSSPITIMRKKSQGSIIPELDESIEKENDFKEGKDIDAGSTGTVDDTVEEHIPQLESDNEEGKRSTSAEDKQLAESDVLDDDSHSARTLDIERESLLAMNDNDSVINLYDKYDARDDISISSSLNELQNFELFNPNEEHGLDSSELSDSKKSVRKLTTRFSQMSTRDAKGKQSGIGAREERKVLDKLTTENFHLKLRISVIEGQLTNGSEEGLAKIAKQLADLKTANDELKRDNEKLRSNIDYLTKSKEHENEQEDFERDMKFRTVEEDLEYYKSEYVTLQDHCVQLEEYSREAESKLEDTLSENERLRFHIASADRTGKTKPQDSIDRLVESLEAPAAVRKGLLPDFRDGASPTPESARLYRQVEHIKRVLSPTYDYHSPRSRSRLSATSSLPDVTLYESGATDYASDLLQQVQDAAFTSKARFNGLHRDYEALEHEYNELVAKYNVMLEKNDHDVQVLEQCIEEKDNELQSARQDFDELWESMNEVKDSLNELEELRAESHNLQDLIHARDEELMNLRLNSNNANLELESKINEVVRLTRELESLRAQYDESQQLIQQVEDGAVTQEQLEEYMNKLEDKSHHIRSLEDELAVLDRRVKEGEKSTEKLDLILGIVKTSYSEKTDLDNVIQHLKDAFDTVKEVQDTATQMNQVVSENGRLTSELSSKKKELEVITKKLTVKEAEATDMSKRVEELEERLQSELTRLLDEKDHLEANLKLSHEDISELEEARHELEIELSEMRTSDDQEIARLTKALSGVEIEKERLSKSLKEKNDILNSMLQVKNGLQKEVEKLKSKAGTSTVIQDEYTRLKIERKELVRKHGELKKQCQILEKQRDDVIHDAKDLQDQLEEETARNDELERKLAGDFENSDPAKVAELERTLEILQSTKADDNRRIEVLDHSLAQALEINVNQLISALKQVESVVGNEWASKIKHHLSTASERPKQETISNLAQVLNGSLEALISRTTAKLKAAEKVYVQLKEDYQIMEQQHQGSANSIETLKEQLSQLETENEELNEKLNSITAMAEFGPTTSKGSSSSGENSSSNKKESKAGSGSFIGRLWLSRYHEMERRWQNEREARKREYEGYKQHLNECYERIEAQKKNIRRLQLRLKEAIDLTPPPPDPIAK